MNIAEFADAIVERLQDLPEERLRALTNGNLEETLSKAFSEELEVSSHSLVMYAKDHMHERLSEERQTREGFESRLFSRWKPAFDIYDIFRIIALDAGRSFYERNVEQTRREKDFVFDALFRIHAKACLTASEVYSLMLSGHASAAMARWRTAHELAIVAYFIKKHGQDTAQRYLLHNVIESWKIISVNQRYFERIGYEPPEQQEVDAVRAERDGLCARYGNIYGKNYGWAAAALEITDPKKQIKFGYIESESGIDHLRPFYKMASHGIHSESKGIYWNIGTAGRSGTLAGASDTGFCDPAHATLISLHQCTVCFVMTKPDIEDVMITKAMGVLLDEAGQTFLDIQKNLEVKEREQEAKEDSRDS